MQCRADSYASSGPVWNRPSPSSEEDCEDEEGATVTSTRRLWFSTDINIHPLSTLKGAILFVAKCESMMPRLTFNY